MIISGVSSRSVPLRGSFFHDSRSTWSPTKPNLRFASKVWVDIAVERPFSREGYNKLLVSWIGLCNNVALVHFMKEVVAEIGKIFFHGSRSTRAHVLGKASMVVFFRQLLTDGQVVRRTTLLLYNQPGTVTRICDPCISVHDKLATVGRHLRLLLW